MSFPIGSLTIGLREGGGEGGGLRAWGLLQQIWNPPSVLLSRPLPLSRMGAIEFPTTVRKGGLQRPLSVFTPKILRTQIGGVQSISAIQLLPDRHRHPGLERWQTWSPGSSPVQDLKITIKTSQTNILQVSSPPYYTELLSHRNSPFFWTGHIFHKKWSRVHREVAGCSPANPGAPGCTPARAVR